MLSRFFCDLPSLSQATTHRAYRIITALAASLKRTPLLLGLLLLCVSLQANAGLRVGSWNLKHLGWNNHKNLPAVAQVMARFDLIGLQEVMYPEHLQPLLKALEAETGSDWNFSSSRTVGGNGYKEGYAFLWRPAVVTRIGHDVLFLDGDNDFLRQPYSVVFAAADGSVPEFVAATIHIKYGDNRADRTPEIRALADYWRWLQSSFDNRPIVLMGDFNLAIRGEKSWRPLSRLAKPYVIDELTTLSKKPGRYANAYDHFWVTPTLTVTSSGVLRAPEMLGISHKTAYASISDHAPIYLTLGDAQVSLAAINQPKIHDQMGATDAHNLAAERACVDLNSAPASRLETLIHVGPATAKRIIAGRPWKKLTELVRIRGLTDSRVDDIRLQGRVCSLTGR